MSDDKIDEKNSEETRKNYGNVVPIEEVDMFVHSLRKFHLNDIGSKKWLDCHEMIIKLSQQAIIDASSYQDEFVKESLIMNEKLKILVHEAYCILVWKTKVLPLILEINPNPEPTFMIYTVLFHEGSVISLLEVALFHQNGCESLDETCLDLVDYCAQALSQLIGLVSMGHTENTSNFDVDESVISELERQKRDLIFKIGIRCISILNYIVDKLDALPLNVGRRMIKVHDIPCLLSDILHFRPWLRRKNNGFEKFIDEKWVPAVGEKLTKISKHEAQTWFCFRQLLFNVNLMPIYEITDIRQRQLAKCRGLLNEVVLDQLPPLAELKHFLCTLQVSQKSTSQKAENLLLEEVPDIKKDILSKAEKGGGFYEIALKQSESFFSLKRDEIFSLAKRLNDAYNTDMLAEIEDNSTVEENKNQNSDGKEICKMCKKDADKKCSKCLSTFYCSKECQLEDWPAHKAACKLPA